MKHKLYNRLLSLALAVGLVVGMLPGVTFASAVDSDATALQSQVEQIAEPTEEPEANDAPQAEPRAQTNQVTVQYVDTNGSEIQNNSSEQINYSDDQEINVEAYAKDIPNYTFNHAEVDGTTIIAVRVKKSTGFFGNVSYNLQYKIDPEDWWQDEWNDWPNSWGRLSPLVLVYEKNEEPEPTPTPDPTPDPGDRPSDSAGISIADNISTNGTLDVDCSIANVDHYVWYRGETWTEVGSAEGIDPQRVSGNEYNVDPGDDGREGDWLNAALDRQLMEDANPNLNDSMRYCYKVSAVDAEGNILGSAYYQVPYYFQLQNGSFENPVAGRDEGHKGKDNNYELGEYGYQPFYENDQYDSMVWKTTSEKTVDSSWNQKTYHLIEIVSGRTQPFRNNAEEFHKIPNGQMADGVQCAELNAEAAGSLYQDVMTAPGASLNWQLSHLGRDGSDTMYVLIMSTDLAKDIDTQEEVNDVIRDVQHNSGQRYPGARVWEITTSNQAWKTYTSEGTTDVNNQTGAYLVPNGQYLTRFFFVSGKTASGDNTVGNHLDDVSFGTDMPEPDVGKGNLEVVKTVTGVAGGDLPEDYSVTVHVNGQESKTINNFSYNSQTGVYTGTAQFLNIPEGSYTVTETVNNNLTVDGDGYEYDKDNSKTEVTVQVGDRENVTANLKNVYIEDTSDEYPVRFYLEGIKTHQVTENYTFTDEWAKLNADLIGGFANVTSTLYGGEDYPNLDGEAGYDSAVIGGSVSGGIRGHANVETWLEKYKCAPNIDTHNIANVLDDLIKMYPQIANVPVTVVGDEEYTVSEIKNTLQTDSDAFQIVYTQVTKNHDAITEHFGGNGSVAGGQDSYHVHLSIRKNPGDLTITKTFAGLDEGVVPENFAIEVKASNGTLIDTLTLDEATLKDDTYTWTLENLNEDTYTVTETGTDVENMVLSATMKVTDEDVQTQETVEDTTAQVKVANNKTSTVDITNTYSLAEQTLKVYKNLSGFANEGKPVFSFKIWDLETGDVWYYHIDMTGKDIGEDELVIALTLPAGHEYRVEELSNQNYRFVKLEQDGTVINPLHSRALLIPTGGDITLEKDTKLVFYNDPVNSNIPTDGGATENRVDKIKDGVIVWKKEVYGTDHPEAQPSPNPNDNKD